MSPDCLFCPVPSPGGEHRFLHWCVTARKGGISTPTQAAPHTAVLYILMLMASPQRHWNSTEGQTSLRIQHGGVHASSPILSHTTLRRCNAHAPCFRAALAPTRPVQCANLYPLVSLQNRGPAASAPPARFAASPAQLPDVDVFQTEAVGKLRCGDLPTARKAAARLAEEGLAHLLGDRPWSMEGWGPCRRA